MDKDQIIAQFVYDTALAAMRAQVDVDAATANLEAATALRDQANLAAEIVASTFGVDIAATRAMILKTAAL